MRLGRLLWRALGPAPLSPASLAQHAQQPPPSALAAAVVATVAPPPSARALATTTTTTMVLLGHSTTIPRPPSLLMLGARPIAAFSSSAVAAAAAAKARGGGGGGKGAAAARRPPAPAPPRAAATTTPARAAARRAGSSSALRAASFALAAPALKRTVVEIGPYTHLNQQQQRPDVRTAAAAARGGGGGARAVTATKKPQPSPSTAPPLPSFAELGLSPPLVEAVERLGIAPDKPTEVQALALPALLAAGLPAPGAPFSPPPGGDFLIASHTGSGKTLAYLLPLVELLKREERAPQFSGSCRGGGNSEGEEEDAGNAADADAYVPRPRRPRLLVLAPTKELATQIGRVCKQLCHVAKFRCVTVSAQGTLGAQKAALAAPADVVVATPGRLLQLVDEGGALYLGDVRWVVVDEADTLFDRGFGPEVRRVLTAVRSRAAPARAALVSATMTKAVRRLVAEDLPGAKTLETRTLHRAVEGSRHEFVTVPPGRDRRDVLADLVEGDARRGRRVLVFCGSVDSCRAVEHYCAERGLASVCYHGDMPIPERGAALEAFAPSDGGGAAAGGGDDDGGAAAASSPSSSRRQPIMVATDLAARGLDFPGRVDHVVNFDFPSNPVDYLHRTGRTARAGAPGRVTSIVSKRDRVLASRVEWALKHGEPLDALSADAAVLPPSQQAVRSRERANREARAGKMGGDGTVGAAARAAKEAGKGRRGAAEAAAKAAAAGASLKGLRGAARAEALQAKSRGGAPGGAGRGGGGRSGGGRGRGGGGGGRGGR